jgi:RND family efflux transporter MFP subunit
MSDPHRHSRSGFIALITRLVVGGAIIVIAFGIAGWLVGTRPIPQMASGDRPGREVLVLEVQQHSISRQFKGYGVAEAFQRADVPSRVQSTVTQLSDGSRAGRHVATGAVLAQLDDLDFRMQRNAVAQQIIDLRAQITSRSSELLRATDRLEFAQEELSLKQTQLGRVQRARDSGAAHDLEVEAALQDVLRAQSAASTAQELAERLPASILSLEAQVRRFENDHELAEELVKRCTITSPIDGVIESIDVRVGESLQPGSRVARIVNPDHIELPIRLPASARSFIGRGDRVSLRASGTSSLTWEATVQRVSPENDPLRRTMTVYVDLQQDSSTAEALAPGQFVEALVASSTPQESWLVPRRSLRSGRVLLAVDGMIQSTMVESDFAYHGDIAESGLPDRDWIVLAQPLAAGSLVIVEPSRLLRDGMRVQPIRSDESGAAVDRKDSAK